MPSTSGDTITDETGLTEPEADTASSKSSRVTVAVAMVLLEVPLSDGFWLRYQMTPSTTRTATMTTARTIFFRRCCLRWRMRLS